MKKNTIFRNLVMLLFLIVFGLFLHEVIHRFYDYFTQKSSQQMANKRACLHISACISSDLDKIQIAVLKMLLFPEEKSLFDSERQINGRVTRLKNSLEVLKYGGEVVLNPQAMHKYLPASKIVYVNDTQEDHQILAKLDLELADLQIKISAMAQQIKRKSVARHEISQNVGEIFMIIDSMDGSAKKIFENSVLDIVNAQQVVDKQNDFYLVVKTTATILGLAIILFLGIKLARQLIKYQSKLEKANLNIEEIIDSMPVGVVIIAEDLTIQGANKEAVRIMGAESIDDVLGIPGEEIFGKDKNLEDTGELHKNAGVGHEGVITNLKEETIQILKSYIPITIDDRNVVLQTMSDISVLKKIQQELIVAKNEAEAANEAKSSFLSMMSHEIRTPMNGVIGMTDLLETTELDEEQMDYVDTIKISGDALLSVINDILDYSKIESGKMKIESFPFKVESLIDDTLDLFAVTARKKKIKLVKELADDVPEFILGDITRVRQVLVNLIGNALKFTDKGSVIVSVREKNRKRSRKKSPKLSEILFCVKDTGIGISKEGQKRLFKDFSQVDSSTTRKYGGTGLGLAICKLICQMMKGAIWVESAEGKGAAFFFTIKATIVEDRKNKERKADLDDILKEAKYQNLKILVAEDNSVNRKLAEKIFSKLGYKAEMVTDGVELLSEVKNQSYDMVFMDCEMPNMDGYTATREIRKIKRLKDMPIIAMTANVMEGDREKCLQTGMNDYITKPVKLVDIKTMILKWTG